MTDQTEDALPDLTGDWDAAHRALIYAHRAAVEDIERMDTMAAESRGRAQQADLMGDQGERRITLAQLDGMSLSDAAELERRIWAAVESTPGLQVNRTDDLKTGDIIIRWRTRV